MELAHRMHCSLLGVLLLGVGVPASLSTAGEPATRSAAAPTSQPAISDAAFDAALDATRNAIAGPAFDATLRSVAPRFPELTVSTEPGPPIWNKLTMNLRGKWIDAVRFRVPEGEPRDLVWALISNETRYEWYIFAVDGQPMQGFARNWYYKPQDILRDRTPSGAKDLMLQSLPASRLRPGAEYVIWLKFRHGKPRPTYIALSLLPAAADPTTIDAPDYIVRTLGLSPAGDSISATAVDITPTTQATTISREVE